MPEAPLSSLLARWEAARAAGTVLSPAEVCHDCPERAAELAALLEARAADEQATLAPPPAPLDSAATLAPPPSHGHNGGPAAVPGYVIEGELGRGGMGVVYKARQKGLNRPVALKMVLAASHAAPGDRERFRAEAEAVAALQHPNIVQVFEVGEHLGQPFFSLELCPLGSLDKKLNGTPLPVRESAALTRVLARAMQAAHDAGVVHRDLKPANILLQRAEGRGQSSEVRDQRSGSEVTASLSSDLCLLTSELCPKITDFGLAKRLGSDSGQTRTGAVLGTPSYMAPEQAEGKKDVGPPADIYALGAILYECLTGRPPFRAASALDTVLQVVSEEPAPPRQLNHLVPRDLETICLKCLQKEPARRYASAAALADDLGRFLAGEPIQARPVTLAERGVKWARRRPAIAGLLALVLALTGLGVLLVFLEWRRAELARGEAEIAHQLSDARAVLAEHARADADDQRTLAAERLALAEASKRLADDRLAQATRALAQARQSEYFRRVAAADRSLQARQFARAAAALDECPLDGRGFEWGYLKRLASPEAVRCAGHWNDVWAVAFSPDGQALVTGGLDRALRVWDARTGRPRRELTEHAGMISACEFSPDGRLLASATQTINFARLNAGLFTASYETATSGSVMLWDTRSWRPLGPDLEGVACVAFSPDGARLAAGNKREVLVYDLATRKLLHRLAGHKMFVNRLAFSPDGARLLSGAADLNKVKLPQWGSPAPIQTAGELRLWDVKTGREVTPRWPAPAGGITGVTFLPGGGRAASLSLDGALEVWDIAEGKRLHQLRGHEARTEGLCLRPDGRVLTVGLDERAIFWDVATGQKLRTLDGPSRVAALSRDGRWLACTAAAGQPVRIFDLDRRAGRELPLAKAGLVADVAFSHDGARLFALSKDGARQLVGFDAATGKELYRVPSRGNRLVVTPDDRHVITGGKGELVIRDAATGKELHQLRGHSVEVVSLSLDASGRWLASSACDESSPAFGTGQVIIWDLPARQAHRTIPRRGIAKHVHAVAISPDGARVAAASADRTLVLIDRATGHEEEVKTDRVVKAVAFHPGGQQLATGGADGSVHVWGLAVQGEQDGTATKKVWKVLKTIQDVSTSGAAQPAVETVAYARGGLQLLTASYLALSLGEVKLWDVESEEEVLSLPGRRAVALSRDGRRVAAGGEAAVRVWALGDEGELRATRGHDGSVRGMAASRDGRQFATVGDDGVVKLWSAATGEVVRELRGHAGRVWDASFSPDGKRLLSAGVDGARVWDVETGKVVRRLAGHKGDATAAAYLADDLAATAGVDGQLRLWRVSDATLLRTLHHDISVFSLSASPDGKRLASASDAVRVWDIGTGEKLLELEGTGVAVRVAWSPAGDRLAVAESEGALRLWDATTGALLVKLGNNRQWALSWDRTGRLLACVGDDRVTAVFDGYTGREAATFSGARLWGAAVACLAGGVVASGDATGAVRFFRLPPPTAGPAAPRPDYPLNATYAARLARAAHRAGRHAEALSWAAKWRERSVWKEDVPEVECLSIEAQALLALGREGEARPVAARLRELMRNERLQNDPASAAAYKEAVAKVGAAELPAEEEAVRAAVVAAEVAGWAKRDHEAYLALRLPGVKVTDARGPEPSPHDVTRDLAGVRFWLKCWGSGDPSPAVRRTTELGEVTVRGATAEVRGRNTVAYPGGFYTAGLLMRLEKGRDGWKVASQRHWAAARRNGGSRLVYDAAGLARLDAAVEVARRLGDARALRQALKEARRWPEAHAVARKITEGPRPTPGDWLERAELALEAGAPADVILSVRQARRLNEKVALPFQLQAALGQAK